MKRCQNVKKKTEKNMSKKASKRFTLQEHTWTHITDETISLWQMQKFANRNLGIRSKQKKVKEFEKTLQKNLISLLIKDENAVIDGR